MRARLAVVVAGGVLILGCFPGHLGDPAFNVWFRNSTGAAVIVDVLVVHDVVDDTGRPAEEAASYIARPNALGWAASGGDARHVIIDVADEDCHHLHHLELSDPDVAAVEVVPGEMAVRAYEEVVPPGLPPGELPSHEGCRGQTDPLPEDR